MSDGDKVVFLAFSNPNLKDDQDVHVSACTHCRNKTFLLSHDSHSGFPMVKCAACGAHIGRVGWADDDD